jgi:hypothetical protein
MRVGVPLLVVWAISFSLMVLDRRWETLHRGEIGDPVSNGGSCLDPLSHSANVWLVTVAAVRLDSQPSHRLGCVSTNVCLVAISQTLSNSSWLTLLALQVPPSFMSPT